MSKAPLKLSRDPLPFAGCYSLDLYCKWENPEAQWHDTIMDERMGQFIGPSHSHCVKMARSKGWIVHKDRTATCPLCAKRAKARRDDTERGQGDE